MLEGLVGNKNVQNILLFLFVNGKCYGAQCARMLRSPLTPIQKALMRLEKGGIVISFFEGKTRFYQFNPSYPLLLELEELLKKAYARLTPTEKKPFNFVLHTQTVTLDALLGIWQRLTLVKSLQFKAQTKSKKQGGWNAQGSGEVVVERVNDKVLVFHEKGSWKNKQQETFDFHNSFRWTLHAESVVISLEHLRHGVDHPVFLFHLAPTGSQSLASIDSHLCDGDAYFGQIVYDNKGLRLNWRVIGPKKNEELETYYH